MGRGGASRGLWRLRWLAVLAALAMAAASCGGPAFEAGPLGAVEVAPGEAIQIRSMQVLTGLGDLGIPIQRGAAFAVEDYGPIQAARSRWARASTRCAPRKAAVPPPRR